jgi:hypothetical protein
MTTKGQEQRQVRTQIPFGNDNQKGISNSGNGMARATAAAEQQNFFFSLFQYD